MSQPSKTLILWAHLRLACGSQQLCSARKTPAAFCLSLPARNERGESRREGKLIKNASSPRPSPPFLRRRGREDAVLRSKQIFCRTQLVCDRQEFCPPSVLTIPARRSLSTCCGSQSSCVRHAKRLRGFALSLPTRNERGESRREGKLIKSASSPRPSPPF